MKVTLLSSETSAKERSKQDIYDSNGVLIKQSANLNELYVDVGEESSFKAFTSKSVDEQRREEIRLIMRDRSLSKDERAECIETVKAKYTAAAKEEATELKNVRVLFILSEFVLSCWRMLYLDLDRPNFL